MQQGHIRPAPFLGILALSVLGFGGAQTDGTLGPRRSFAGHFTVPATVGQQRGGNLFHSFSTFGVARGESATFAGPSSVRNVIVRVTGDVATGIDGAVGCSIANADLYIMNPAGFAFGPNAKLNVRGSFAVATADYLRCEDGRWPVAATGDRPPPLRSMPPEAFGFLGGRAAPITVDGGNRLRLYDLPVLLQINERSALAVPTGRTLSLVAGNVEVTGTSLRAPGGRLELLASGAAPGEWPVAGPMPNAAAAYANAGTVILRQASQLDASAAAGGLVWVAGRDVSLNRTFVSDDTRDGDSGGMTFIDGRDMGFSKRIRIAADARCAGRGGDVTMRAGENMSFADAEVSSSAFASGHAGDITLSAGAGMAILKGSEFFANTMLGSTGGGGNLTVSARGDLVMNHGGALSTEAAGTGSSGVLTVRAGRSLRMTDDFRVFTDTLGDGQGGDVTFTAGTSLTVDGQSDVSAFSEARGQGGDVTFSAGTDLSFTNVAGIGAGTNAGGRGGNVTLRAGRDVIFDRGSVSSNTRGSGAGGAVTLDAGRDISLTDLSTISAPTYGSGRAGSITLRARGAVGITGESAVTVDTSGTGANAGRGGNVLIDAGSITVRGNGRSGPAAFVTGITAESTPADPETTPGDGPAGSVTLRSRSSVEVLDLGVISVDSARSGGGDLSVTAGTRIRLYDGRVTARAAQDGAGLRLSAPLFIALAGRSVVSTQAGGNGGNIDIDPLTLSIGHRSLVNASGGRNGGAVRLSADRMDGVRVRIPTAPRPSDNVIATGGTGVSGSVGTGPANTDVTNAIGRLPVGLLGAEVRLQPQCGETGAFSSFLVTGSGGLSLDPQSWQWDEPATAP